MRKSLYSSLPVLLMTLPLFLAFIAVSLSSTVITKTASLLLAASVFILTFIFISGLMSKWGQRGIIAGVFPRDIDHHVYSKRRIFGLCWTALYYFKPLYWLVLSTPILKRMTFRLFGYKGSHNFTIYPDCWIRDLALLDIGENAYLANRATIGTNMCLSDGTVLVEAIKIGDNSVIGHLSMIGCGVKIGNNCEIGAGVIVGIRSQIDDNTRISPSAAVYHNVIIEKNVSIGGGCLIGSGSFIKEGIRIPLGTVIPPKTSIHTQDEVFQFCQSIQESKESA